MFVLRLTIRKTGVAVTKAKRVFTPAAVRAMNRAYDEACEELRRAGEGYTARVRAGERIMVLAQGGETDVRKLSTMAVEAALGHARRV